MKERLHLKTFKKDQRGKEKKKNSKVVSSITKRSKRLQRCLTRRVRNTYLETPSFERRNRKALVRPLATLYGSIYPPHILAYVQCKDLLDRGR